MKAKIRSLTIIVMAMLMFLTSLGTSLLNTLPVYAEETTSSSESIEQTIQTAVENNSIIYGADYGAYARNNTATFVSQSEELEAVGISLAILSAGGVVAAFAPEIAASLSSYVSAGTAAFRSAIVSGEEEAIDITEKINTNRLGIERLTNLSTLTKNSPIHSFVNTFYNIKDKADIAFSYVKNFPAAVQAMASEIYGVALEDIMLMDTPAKAFIAQYGGDTVQIIGKFINSITDEPTDMALSMTSNLDGSSTAISTIVCTGISFVCTGTALAETIRITPHAYVDESGELAIIFQSRIGVKDFWADGAGTVLTSWQKIGDHVYYFGDGIHSGQDGHIIEAGTVYHGWLTLNGKTYFLDDDGVAVGKTVINTCSDCGYESSLWENGHCPACGGTDCSSEMYYFGSLAIDYDQISYSGNGNYFDSVNFDYIASYLNDDYADQYKDSNYCREKVYVFDGYGWTRNDKIYNDYTLYYDWTDGLQKNKTVFAYDEYLHNIYMSLGVQLDADVFRTGKMIGQIRRDGDLPMYASNATGAILTGCWSDGEDIFLANPETGHLADGFVSAGDDLYHFSAGKIDIDKDVVSKGTYQEYTEEYYCNIYGKVEQGFFKAHSDPNPITFYYQETDVPADYFVKLYYEQFIGQMDNGTISSYDGQLNGPPYEYYVGGQSTYDDDGNVVYIFDAYKSTKIELKDADIYIPRTSFVFQESSIKPILSVRIPCEKLHYKHCDSIFTNTTLNLLRDKEYSVSYSDNTTPGTGSVTITGLGNFKGTITKSFEITKCPISDSSIFYSGLTSKPYTGTAIKPEVTLKRYGNTLINGTDYSVSYSNNINAGTATVTFTGKGNYTGTVKKYFSILPQSLPSGFSAYTVYPYTGSALKFVLSQIPEGLTKNDYEIVYDTDQDYTSRGEKTVTVKGKGNYTGRSIWTVYVGCGSIESWKGVHTWPSQIYTGKAITPSFHPTFSATNGEKGLTLNQDYQITYKNNVNVGTASVTYTGIGNYWGSFTETFKITKAANPLSVTKKDKSTLYSSVSRANVSFKLITVTDAQGTVSYSKSSGASCLSVNATNGKITIKKGTAKGTYTIKVKVTAAGNSNYRSKSITVAIKVTVK